MDLDDPFSETPVVKAPAAGKFQPKAKPRPKKGPSVNVPSVVVKSTKEPSVTSIPQDSVLDQLVQSNNVVEKKSDAPISSSLTLTESLGDPLVKNGNLSPEARELSGSAVAGNSEVAVSSPVGGLNLSADSSLELQLPHKIIGLPTNEACCPTETPTTDASSIQNEEDLPCFTNVCNDGDFQIDVEQLEAGDFSCFDSIDLTSEGVSASGKRAVKFQPKPKAQSDRLKAPAEAVSYHPHGPELPAENFHTARDGVIHDGEPDPVSDVLPQQGREHHGEKSSYDALDSLANPANEGFLPENEGNENGYGLFDGINFELLDNSNSHYGAPDESASVRDENNDVTLLEEQTSQMKKPRKSKKVASENDKPVRKRRKATQELDVSSERPPKKFPRATRRKRCVDKALLEAPEEELDLQRVPIRDLIILAEYKERQAKKEAASLPPPSTSDRNDNTLSEDFPYDDEAYGFDQDRDAYDNPSTSEVQKDTGYFNYQSHMQKEPRVRWTKQDTELFYQGICQFGSDLSMVQQLFPGRTRHQIKLKYKKEERQNPMRLHDALTSRTQDLSHFELVIARLQEQDAQDAKTDKDDSVYQTGDDEGPEDVNSHEDVAKSERSEEVRVPDQEPDKCQVESPPKSYQSEEEDFDWSGYNGEL